MQITVRKKDLVILLVILFVGAGAVPSTGMHILEKESSIVSYDGSILYVGGSGLNNYTTIQSAVDVSVDGDTVFVYDDSSPYSENVMVNKSIDLIGENKETTIIDGNEINHTVGFFADGINIREFTLRHSEELDEEFMCILFVGSNNNTISDIIFICKPFRRETAIMLLNSSRNLIIHSVINDNYDRGIELRNSHYNDISENVINGLIWKRGIGISVIDSSNNLIKRNEFRKNSCCVNLHELSNLTTNNQIIQNNFLSYYFRMSGVYFYYDYHRFQGNRGNTFDENYWNRPRLIPKYILGWISLFWIPITDYGYLLRIPLPKFDMHPTLQPYDISPI